MDRPVFIAAGIAGALASSLAAASSLSVEFPTRYELIVNARSESQYSIVLPSEFLVRADRMIG